MPFKSQHQIDWIKENKPALYSKMLLETVQAGVNPDKLPQKVKKSKTKNKAKSRR